jgi:hypothetical protein
MVLLLGNFCKARIADVFAAFLQTLRFSSKVFLHYRAKFNALPTNDRGIAQSGIADTTKL